jgi:hypothetical protein
MENYDPKAMAKKLDKKVEALMAQREEILEKFCEAYLVETGLKPSEAELVTRVDDKGKFVMYFRKREIIRTV